MLTAPAAEPGRRLPEDPDEFQRVISKYKVLSRPLMSGVSRLCKTAKVDPLDAHEEAAGSEAFAALFYQYQAEFDARLLVALWLVSVVIPRLIDWLDRREEQRSKAKTSLGPIAQAA